MNKLNQSRRNFLRVSAAGAGAVALSAMDSPLTTRKAAATPLPNYKRLVVINMLGGNDCLNTLVPVTGAVANKYMQRRPTLGLTPGQCLSMAGGPGVSEYMLHPSFDSLQSMWNAGEVAFVNKVGYPQANLSHFVSEDIWSYGARSGLSSLSGTAHGWVARYGNTYAPTPMALVSIGVGRRLDFAGANTNPFLVSSVASFNFDNDSHYTNNHTLRKQVALDILSMQQPVGLAGEVAAAAEAAHVAATQVQTASVDYNDYATLNSIQYPLRAGSTTQLTNMGRRMRDVAMLMHGGFDTRVFYTGYGGFDTHSDQAPRHADLLAELDDALGVFKQDLQTQGIWNDVVVVVISEFGRRNFENGSNGTDHGHGNCIIAIGAPVTGGIYGDPITEANLDANYLPYTTDFRDVYRNLIGAHLGSDPTPLFPESQPINNPVNIV